MDVDCICVVARRTQFLVMWLSVDEEAIVRSRSFFNYGQ